MAQNKRGPYIVEIPYTVAAITHSLTVNCLALETPTPGSDPTDVMLATRGPADVTLAAGVNAFWALVRLHISTAALASTYTLWKLNDNNNEKLYVSSGVLTAVNGFGHPYGPAEQTTFTFRTAGSGIMKIVTLEDANGSFARAPLNPTDGLSTGNLAAYVTSNSNWLLGADDTWPVQALNVSYGQNEKLFNRRFRA